MSLKDQVKKYILSQGLIPVGAHILAAVSGGADSVCLLAVLKDLQRDLGFDVKVVHVDHMLRDSSAYDAAFVEDICRKWDIPAVTRQVDVRKLCKERGLGTEEAARILRYEALEEELASWKEDGRIQAEDQGGQEHPLMQASADTKMPGCTSDLYRIALAHHVEDQAETVLFHLCRGTSLTGLAGMRPLSGHLIRPLLTVSRAQIEQDLANRGQPFCTDETNADTSYTRNYLRNVIFPMLQEHVNAQAIQHFAQAADAAAGARDYLEEQASDFVRQYANSDLPVKSLRDMPHELRGQILYRLITQAAGARKDISSAHVEAVEDLLMTGKGSRRADLPYGLMALREYDRLRILPRQMLQEDPDKIRPSSDLFICPGSEDKKAATASVGDMPNVPDPYRIRVFPYAGDPAGIPSLRYTKWFDYDKMFSLLEFRTRRPGDRIVITDDGRSKPLKKFMIDEKIPAGRRDSMILPFAGDQVIWVPGYRISSAFKVTDRTRTILEISFHHKTQEAGS